MGSSFDETLETPEMETLASLADNVVYRLPGCSDVMIRKTLQETYRDFCRRSCCLCGRRHFRISYDNPDVYVAPLHGGVIESIVEVTYDRRRLGPRDYMVMGNRITFRDGLVPYEGCEEDQLPDIVVRFVEIPKLNSEEVPCWFVQQYGEQLCAGVIAVLSAMTGKPWSDPAQATVDRIVYENAVNEARARFYGDNRSGDVGSAIGNDELL